MNKILLFFVTITFITLGWTQSLPQRTNPSTNFRVEYQNHNLSRAVGDSCGYLSNAYLAIDKIQSGVWWNGAYRGASAGSPGFSEAGQYFTAPQDMKIDGFQIVYYFTPENTATSMPVVGKIYEALADSTPGNLLAVDTIFVDQQTPGTTVANYATFDFDNDPIISGAGNGFFLSVRAYTNDSIFFLSNDDGQDEDLSYAYFENVDVPANSYWVNYLSYGPAYDYDHLFFPIFKFEFSNDYTLNTDTVCRGSDVCMDVTNFSGILYDSLWNPNHGNDSLYLGWDLGSGVEGNAMKSYCATPTTAGNVSIAMLDSVYFYNDATPFCPLNVTKQIFVVDSVDADFTFTNTGLQVDFTNTSMNADTYLWNFGDMNTSTDTNVSHTYAANGVYTVHLKAYNQCFEDSSIQSVDLSTVGIPEWDIRDIRIYPNPTKRLVYIDSEFYNEEVELTVINVLGKIVLQRSITSDLEQVDLDSFGQGTYFFNIKSDGLNLTRKVVVQ